MQEIQVGSLGREDLLEERIATPSSILAWIIPWTEKPAGPHSTGSQRVRYMWKLLWVPGNMGAIPNSYVLRSHEIFAACFMSLDMFQCLLVYTLWELVWKLNRSYLYWIGSQGFWGLLYSSLIFILLIFESLILKFQFKILIYLFKKII